MELRVVLRLSDMLDLPRGFQNFLAVKLVEPRTCPGRDLSPLATIFELPPTPAEQRHVTSTSMRDVQALHSEHPLRAFAAPSGNVRYLALRLSSWGFDFLDLLKQFEQISLAAWPT
jgi:hypothetical protein